MWRICPTSRTHNVHGVYFLLLVRIMYMAYSSACTRIWSSEVYACVLDLREATVYAVCVYNVGNHFQPERCCNH